MKIFLLFLNILLVSTTICYAELPIQLKPAVEILAQESKTKVRLYSTRDFGRSKYEGAISVLVPDSNSKSVLASVRKLLPAGLVAFIGTTHSLTQPPAVGVEIVVGPGLYPLDILDISQTDAVNYDMETKHLKEKLGKWHSAYGIDIWQAETDTIQLKFFQMPVNIKDFAKEVYEFCPDIIDQGFGNLVTLEQAIKEEQGLHLWWD